MADAPTEQPTASCRTCGAEREDRQDWATRCDGCLRRDGRLLWIVVAVFSAAVGFALTRGGDGDWRGVALGFAVGLTLGYPLHVLLHELGHAIAARLSGMRLTRMVLGNGPLVASAYFRGTTFALHRYQGIGSTWVDTTSRDRYRSQWTAFCLGGPLLSVLAAVGSLLFAGRSMIGAGCLAFGILNAFMAIVTLRPNRGLGGAVSSDIADLRERRAMADVEIAAEIAYTASQRVEEAERLGSADLAMMIAVRFLEDFPESDERAWFEQVVALGAG